MRERSKANGQRARSADVSALQSIRHLQPRVTGLSGEFAAKGTCAVTRGQQALLLKILDALCEQTERADFLAQVIAAVAEESAAHLAYLCLHCEDQDILRLESCYVREGLAPVSAPGSFPDSIQRTAPAGSLWRELLRAPKPILVPNALKDVRVPFRDLLLADGLNNLLLVPLLNGKRPLGLIGIMGPGPESYEPKEILLAQDLARQAVVALQLARFVDKARQDAVLQERSRVARDFHDTLAQGITGIVFQMNLAEGTVAQNQQEALRHIVRAQELARGCLREARRLVSSLQPLCLKKQCLASALQQLAAEVTSDTAVQVEFSVQCAAPELFPAIESELLHIGQEALTNILKHAGSSKIRIELTSDPQMVRLSIQDDGRGFDISATTPTQGFGLAGMKERASKIGGRLEIRSELGCGTQIQVVVPAGKTKFC
jgi:signal transduction histidine kinase